MDQSLTGEILRGVVAIAVVGGYIYLAATGGTIPEGYGAIVSAVVGFYFGIGSAITGFRLARAR